MIINKWNYVQLTALSGSNSYTKGLKSHNVSRMKNVRLDGINKCCASQVSLQYIPYADDMRANNINKVHDLTYAMVGNRFCSWKIAF